MPRKKPQPLAPEWPALLLQEQAKRRTSGVVARVFVADQRAKRPGGEQRDQQRPGG
jgi:hypothetical protein